MSWSKRAGPGGSFHKSGDQPSPFPRDLAGFSPEGLNPGKALSCE